ncbi:MAG: hypothetical protein WBA31_07375, partial [Candidatus Dormiibacterota bacterium]
ACWWGSSCSPGLARVWLHGGLFRAHLELESGLAIYTTLWGTTEASSLTLTGKLVLGSLSSGEEIASVSSTWKNTDGVNDAVYAQVLCSAFGNGTYSAETTGSFTYEGKTYPVEASSVNNIPVTGC